MVRFTLTCFLLFSSFVLLSQSSFDRQVVDVGNLGLSITNAGTIGRPDVRNDPSGSPSMEYPLNSGIEHLFEGGLWIGAQVNNQTAVSTASVDFPTGYTTGAAGFEFTSAVGSKIEKRSTLTNSDFFSFNAVSHEDFVMDFTDKNVIIPGTTIPISNHNLPLGADVHLQTYAWNFSFADYFVIFDYTITNNSTNNWDSVYLGMWTDLVVRNINVATDGGAAFFNKGAGGYIDSLYALYAFDAQGDPGYTESYGSTQFLGVEWRDLFLHPNNSDSIAAQGYTVPKVFANFWVFRTFDGTQFGAPANDIERYNKLSKGLNFNDPFIRETVQTASNRTQLLSMGPIREIAPGETVKFALAFVAARSLVNTSGCPEGTSGLPGPRRDVLCAREELANNLGWAKRTYLGEDINENGLLDIGEDIDGDQELDRYILPEPPDDPIVKILAENQKINIYWDRRAEESIDPISKIKDFEGYKIYRTNVGDDQSPNLQAELNQIAQFDKGGNDIGFNNGFDAVKLDQPVTFEGDTTEYHYKFELDEVLNGWQYNIVLTAFDQGNEELQIEPLESSFVNNSYRVWPGTPANEDLESNSIGVYPNPYRLKAAWDGNSSRTRKLYFYNLPAQCTITIYTLSGDVVTVLDHDAGSYVGGDSQWYNELGGAAGQRIKPGGEHAWDILSQSDQSVSQGLYLFTVKDFNTGEVYSGRFAVIN